MKLDICTLTIVAILLIVAGAVFIVNSNTGALSLCPPGYDSILEGIPGGGQQVRCVASAVATSRSFDTYGANPYGDYRRQTIATKGYAPLHK